MYVESLYHDMHDSATARKNRENPGGAAARRSRPALPLGLALPVGSGLALSVSGGRLGPLGSWLCNLDANTK